MVLVLKPLLFCVDHGSKTPELLQKYHVITGIGRYRVLYTCY